MSKMLQIFIQIVVLLLAVCAAALKSLRFAASGVTDFELERRVRIGNAGAKAELDFRAMRPLLDALRRFSVLLITIVMVVLLGSVYNFFVAVVLALIWFFVVEVLSSRSWVVRTGEQLSMRYEPQLQRAAGTLRPLLQFLVDSHNLQRGEDVTFYSREELLAQIEQDQSVLDHDTKLLLKQALTYGDRRVVDVMIPRSVLTTVEEDETVGPILLDRLHKSGHSRFPVIRGDLDHVVGILYMHELVPLDPKVKKVSDAMSRKVFYVHQDKSLDHVLLAFLRTQHHLFMVVNEFEEVVGVISIEDVLETIIGRKIVDEFDQYDDLRAVAKLAADERRKAMKE